MPEGETMVIVDTDVSYITTIDDFHEFIRTNDIRDIDIEDFSWDTFEEVFTGIYDTLDKHSYTWIVTEDQPNETVIIIRVFV